MKHFVRTFLIMCASGVGLIAIEDVRNYGKIVYIKNIVCMKEKRIVYIKERKELLKVDAIN